MTAYITITSEYGIDEEYPVGATVMVKPGLVDAFRTGEITGYGRSTEADTLYRQTSDPECLIDGEGPIVRWDDDGTEGWFPGQSMPCLEIIRTPPVVSQQTIDEVARVGREYPDGVHTCAELQKLEPGRRPCTCGRCPRS